MFQPTQFSQEISHSINFNGQNLTLQTGVLAQQATASVLATIGQTTILAAVVIGKKTELDYLPLQVIYEERLYAAGKIKGSRFIKREGRPSDNAILTGRMIDRSIRSVFDQSIGNDIQVVITVLSLDEVNPPDTLAVIASSCALSLATSAFKGPISATRIGLAQNQIGKILLFELQENLKNNADNLTNIFNKISHCLDININEQKKDLLQILSTLKKSNTNLEQQFRDIYANTGRMSIENLRQRYPELYDTKKFIINPNYTQIHNGILDLVVAGDGQNIMMVEAGSQIVSEEIVAEGFIIANQALLTLNQFQKEFINLANSKGINKNIELETKPNHQDLLDYWLPYKTDLELATFINTAEKEEKLNLINRHHSQNFAFMIAQAKAGNYQSEEDFSEFLKYENEMQALYQDGDFDAQFDLEICKKAVKIIVNYKQHLANLIDLLLQAQQQLISQIIKENILEKERRLDGRTLDQVRPLAIQIDVLPRTHGSSLFQRGQTQVLNILTLGTMRDAQTLDDMEDFEESTKRYIHHYNFPAFSVGEIGRYGGPGRREIGHGALAEKALLPVLPTQEEFPYAIRLVSECLGSNGSTSMASTCASTLSLMAGGVPITDMVAGISIGVVIDKANPLKYKILTDIQGAEDHNGDMDFKVTGTKNGVTAIQLDNKVSGLTPQVLIEALNRAKDARIYILDEMQKVIATPKNEISQYAPGVISMYIPTDKIGEVIGPSGKIIKSIIAKFGVEVDINDDGNTCIYAKDSTNAQMAQNYILNLIRQYAVGDVLSGTVFRIESYGAFVKIDNTDKEGMIHISNLSKERVNKVEDIIQMGQKVEARVVEINERGQISLSIK